MQVSCLLFLCVIFQLGLSSKPQIVGFKTSFFKVFNWLSFPCLFFGVNVTIKVPINLSKIFIRYLVYQRYLEFYRKKKVSRKLF